MGVRSDGLVKANEEFAAWLTGDRSMPFGPNGEHVTVRIIDFADLDLNEYVVTTQYIYRAGATEKRADLVLLVNGIPLVVIEAKTPVRSSESWLDGALQVHDDYERNVPELFVPNVFSVATEGKEFRYGSIGLPVELWGPWHVDADSRTPSLQEIDKAVSSMLQPAVVLDLLANFTAYATDKKKRRDQNRRPLPAVRGHEQDRRPCGCRVPQEGPDLAFPRLWQVAPHALCRPKVAAGSGAEESDRGNRCRPGRSRHPDLQHLLRGGHSEPRQGREAEGA